MNVMNQVKEFKRHAVRGQNDFSDLIFGFLKNYRSDIKREVFSEPATSMEKLPTLHTIDKQNKKEITIHNAKRMYRELAGKIGDINYVGEWVEIDQSRINQFSEVTEDCQWIHTDEVRAAKESPFRSTIAHGFLTLSMIPRLTQGTEKTFITAGSARFVVNIGLNKVRFPFPLKSGNRVRAKKKIMKVETVKRGLEVTEEVVIEIENLSKPACIAETIVLLMT